MPASTNEVDVVLNRANVALAKSQRLIASWLPPRTLEETAHAESEAAIEKEEQEIFAPVPEFLGLGATTPQDANNGSSRHLSNRNETLRKKLLGKTPQSKRVSAGQGHDIKAVHAKHSEIRSRSDPTDEEDDDGRSALGKSKQRKRNEAEEKADLIRDREDREVSTLAKGKRGGGSYLDEILSTRSHKRKRKKTPVASCAERATH